MMDHAGASLYSGETDVPWSLRRAQRFSAEEAQSNLTVLFDVQDSTNRQTLIEFTGAAGTTGYLIPANTIPAPVCTQVELVFAFFQAGPATGLGTPGELFHARVVDLEGHTHTGTPSAQLVVRGNNAVAFVPSPQPPIVGTLWSPYVDHSSLFGPSAAADYLILSLAPAFQIVPSGTLLVDPFRMIYWIQWPPGVPFQVPIPNLCFLYGATVYTQVASVNNVGIIRLSNAIYVTLGAN